MGGEGGGGTGHHQRATGILCGKVAKEGCNVGSGSYRCDDIVEQLVALWKTVHKSRFSYLGGGGVAGLTAGTCA